MFKQKPQQQKACCPFNKNHIFAQQKLIFHINRCKDRQKVAHLFGVCQYNSLHFIRKEEMEMHEIICPDKAEVRNLIESLRRSYMAVSRERERSRQKTKRQEQEGEKRRKDEESEQQQDQTLSDCQECLALLQTITLDDHPKLKKYLQKYQNLQRQLSK